MKDSLNSISLKAFFKEAEKRLGALRTFLPLMRRSIWNGASQLR
jgi:hypothetical protein